MDPRCVGAVRLDQLQPSLGPWRYRKREEAAASQDMAQEASLAQKG